MLDADLAVVGAGPAGLATAIGAARRGFRVIVVEPRVPPIDKACGEGLLPDALVAARRLGLELPQHEGSCLDGIRFLHNGLVAEAPFCGTLGSAIRRTVLSAALIKQAERLGVELRWGVSVTGVRGQMLETTAGAVGARWIAAVDGERSSMRRHVGLDRPAATTRYAFRRHFAREPWTQRVEVYWGEQRQAYVTPLESGQVGVAVISRDPHDRVATVLREFPGLREKLDGAEPVSEERGAVTTSRHLGRVVAGAVALVGDAAGSVDAITGEGIGLAFLQAELLARALQQGDLSRYQNGHAELLRRARWMGRALLAMDQSPLLTGVAMRALAGRPNWFRRLVAVHITSV